MDIEIGEIYYLCKPDGTGQYIKPTTKLVQGWGFLTMSYLGNLNKDFKGYNRKKTYITLSELKESIFIHNRDFHKYPDLCTDLSRHLTQKQIKNYKRQIIIDSIIN